MFATRNKGRWATFNAALLLSAGLVFAASPGAAAHDRDACESRGNYSFGGTGHGMRHMGRMDFMKDEMSGLRMRIRDVIRHGRHRGGPDVMMFGEGREFGGGRMFGGGRDNIGLGDMARGVITDQTIREIDRNTKEVETVRRLQDGKKITTKRTIKQTGSGVEVEGTITRDDGETASFKEGFDEDKDGTIVTSREFTNFEGRTRSVKTTIRTEGDGQTIETEITGPDGDKSTVKRMLGGQEGDFVFQRHSRNGHDRSIDQSVEKDDDGNITKRTLVINGGDDDHATTITRSWSGGEMEITISRPDGSVHSITRPCDDHETEEDEE